MYGFKEIDVQGLVELAANSECMLIDVRTDAEVARGGIAGALHLPLHLLPLKIQDLPTDKPVIFYCQSGGRSAQASAFAASKGLVEVYNLQGGVMGWIRSGKPLSSL